MCLMNISPVFLRRSIRKYLPRPVEEEKIEILLRAAMAAPSAHNQQPWAVVVIDDRKILDAIPGFHPYSKMLLTAPLAFLVCGTRDNLKAEMFWEQDCAAAVENVLVEATHQELGSCWMGLHPHEGLKAGMRQLLNIPENLVPFALIALGYSEEEKKPSQRYDPSRVFRNAF